MSSQSLALTNALNSESKSRIVVHKSPLLCLPGELRNRIYKYALSTSRMLQYKSPYSTPKARSHIFVDSEVLERRTTGQKLPFNQLRNVSRQLSLETEDLEIQFNTLMFSIDFDPTAAPHVQLLRFVDSLHPSKHRWLSIVALSPFPTWLCSNIWVHDMVERLKLDVKRLADFCAENPHVHIKYIVSSWKPRDQFFECINPHSLTFPGVFLAMLFDGIDLSHLLPTDLYPACLVQEAKEEQKYIAEYRAHAPKLRIYPATIELGREMENDIYNYLIGEGATLSYVEEWLEQAKEWIEHRI